MGDDLVHVQQCLSATAEREPVSRAHDRERRAFEAEETLLTGDQKGFDPPVVASLHAAEKVAEVGAAGKCARMVVADDKGAKRLRRLDERRADRSENVLVVDVHLGLVLEADDAVADVGQDGPVVLEQDFALQRGERLFRIDLDHVLSFRAFRLSVSAHRLGFNGLAARLLSSSRPWRPCADEPRPVRR